MIGKIKSKVGGGLGGLTEKRFISLQNLDLQWMNTFEIIFFPTEIKITSLLNSGVDSLVASLYIKSIEGIEFPKLDTISINGVKHVTGISYPDTITLNLIEDQNGTVRNWCQAWMADIYKPIPPKKKSEGSGGKLDKLKGAATALAGSLNPFGPSNSDGHSYYYTFSNDQKSSLKNALIIMKTGEGLPSMGGWIKIEGMKLLSIGGFNTLAQNSEEPLTVSLTLSVNLVKLITPSAILKALF